MTNNISTFRIITQNVPCGNMGVTCSKCIKVFIEVSKSYTKKLFLSIDITAYVQYSSHLMGLAILIKILVIIFAGL